MPDATPAGWYNLGVKLPSWATPRLRINLAVAGIVSLPIVVQAFSGGLDMGLWIAAIIIAGAVAVEVWTAWDGRPRLADPPPKQEASRDDGRRA